MFSLNTKFSEPIECGQDKKIEWGFKVIQMVAIVILLTVLSVAIVYDWIF